MHASPAHHLPNGGENLKARARVGHASSVADMQREWDNSGQQVSFNSKDQRTCRQEMKKAYQNF